jgi:hypothetical protein
MLKIVLPLLTAVFLTTIPAMSQEGDPLPAYLERAALSWMRLPDCGRSQAACDAWTKTEGESPDEMRARIATVANEVSASVGTVKYGLLLMSIAFNESQFSRYVDDGLCNDWEWRKTPEAAKPLARGGCDNGHAYSLWQVHPRDKQERTDLEYRGPLWRMNAIAIARDIMLESLKWDGTLRRYTGETDLLAPKAFRRQRMAEAYLAAHPPPRGYAALVGE